MTDTEMLQIANEVASKHGLTAEFLIGYDGKPARKVCVVGDNRKYNPICVLKGPLVPHETLADISIEISNRADITCTYDITNPMNPYTPYVAKGVELLDTIKPDWFIKINVSDLAMNHCGNCILGQLFGDFDDGLESIFSPATPDEFWRNAEEYGFAIPKDVASGPSPKQLWLTLAQAWLEAIASKKSKEDDNGSVFCLLLN